MTEPIRVIIADDQRLLRDSLRIILESAPDISVVALAEDGEQAVALGTEHVPDVMLLDIRMPGMTGLDAAWVIREKNPGIHLALLTTFDEPDLVSEAARAGALGYLLKDLSAEELCAAVRTIARGQPLYQGRSAATLLAGVAASPAPAVEAYAQDDTLTERERDVLRLIGQGKSNLEIAAELVITEATVKTHIKHIFAKLRARDRTHALLISQQRRLV